MFKNIKKYLLISMVVMLLIGAVSSYSYAKSVNLMKAKTDIRLNDAKQDLLKTFTQFNIDNDFTSVKFYDGEKIDHDIAQEFANLDQTPLGSTEPLFFLKNDSSVLIMLYKESDGTNVMKYAEKTNDGWKESESKKPGKSILSFDEIEVDKDYE